MDKKKRKDENAPLYTYNNTKNIFVHLSTLSFGRYNNSEYGNLLNNFV